MISNEQHLATAGTNSLSAETDSGNRKEMTQAQELRDHPWFFSGWLVKINTFILLKSIHNAASFSLFLRLSVYLLISLVFAPLIQL